MFSFRQGGSTRIMYAVGNQSGLLRRLAGLQHPDISSGHKASRFTRDQDGGADGRICLQVPNDALELIAHLGAQGIDLGIGGVYLDHQYTVDHLGVEVLVGTGHWGRIRGHQAATLEEVGRNG